NAPKVVCEPKVWTDAPIIEEYESDSDDDSVSNVQENKEKPSFACTDSVKHDKPSKENVKETGTPNHSPKIKKQDRNGHTRRGLGYAFTRKGCFVCGSFSHLIRDCDFHEKRMAKQAALTKSKNKAHDKEQSSLSDYQEFKGSSANLRGSNERITGKGKIKAGRLDFEDVYYVEELKHYNLYSVSQMCDKKNKAFRVYNLETKRVEETLHVNFLENKPNVVGKGYAWMFDLDYLTNSMNYEPVFVENQANKYAGSKEANNSAGTQANDDQSANSEEIDLHEDHFVLPIGLLTQLLFRGQEIRFKRPLIARYVRSQAFNNDEPLYPDDHSMPHLEDIYASLSEGIFVDSSYDDEGVKSWCDEFKELMKNRFQMSSMGELMVKQKEDDIFISQDKYVSEILKSFDFLSVTLKTSHLQAVKRIFRYLKGQPKLGLWYPKVSSFDLEAYSNNDYAGANLDRKSITGELASPKQIALGKDNSNPLLVDSLLKTIWLSMHHVIAMKYWLFQSKRLLYNFDEKDGIGVTVGDLKLLLLCILLLLKKVVVTEDGIRHDLRLEDADGMECLPNEEIFIELTCMGYEKPPPKLTFYKDFFATQWKFLIHTLVQCISAKRTTWNELSGSIASDVICLATVIINAQVDDLSSHTNQYTSPVLTQKVFANMRRVGKGFSRVETPLFATIIRDYKAKKESQEVREAKEIKVFWFKEIEKGAELQGRKDDDNVVIKDASAIKHTMFDNEEVTITMAQTLIKMKDEKARLLDEQMAKWMHDEEVKQAVAREKQENNDLEKAKVRQQQVGEITQAYQSFEDMLKDFDKEDLDALWRLVKEKLSTAVPTVNKEKALWVKLKRLFELDIEDVLWKLQRQNDFAAEELKKLL
nr:uncharacterized mitochondrial protein AtMg00810-like [Tanacetum cinerariifolium]